MSNYTDDLEYSLAKRVPDMESGFSISTNYGELFIDADEAEPIIKAVRRAIEKNLKIAKKSEARVA